MSIWSTNSIEKRISIGTDKHFKDEDICLAIIWWYDKRKKLSVYTKVDFDKERSTLIEPNWQAIRLYVAYTSAHIL